MIPLRCVLIDDEPLALEVLKQYISRFPELQLVESFSDVVAGEAFLKANLVELLFIDINIVCDVICDPGIHGTNTIGCIGIFQADLIKQ